MRQQYTLDEESPDTYLFERGANWDDAEIHRVKSTFKNKK